MRPYFASIAASLFALATVFLPGTDAAASALAEDTVQFQDGNGNVVHFLRPGETATLFIRDTDLATTGTGSATWAGIERPAPAGTWWSMATGAPEPLVFSLTSDREYDSSDPTNTPLVFPQAPWTAKVDGVDTLVADVRPATGEVTLLTDVEHGSTVGIDFEFDVVDFYGPSESRARVTSTSDPEGEWLSLAEVASETDSASSPTSGVFRGGIELSSNSEAAAPGNAAVFVQDGDLLTVTYYDADGTSILATNSAHIDASIPQPVPAVSHLSLILLASLLAILVWWRWRNHPSQRGQD